VVEYKAQITLIIMKVDLVVEGFLIMDKKVLLILHKKSGKWLGPGGHIDKNETPDEALEREFKEEVGIEIKILNRNDIPPSGDITKQLAVPFYVNVHNVRDHEHCCFYYLCRAKTRTIKPNKSEINDFGWFSREELNQQKILPDTRNIALKAFDLSDSLGNSP